jgi:hypothetical protein
MSRYTQDSKEGTKYSVQAKRFLVASLIAMLLTGCGGTLRLGENRPGLPTATPGIAVKGQAGGDPAAAPAPVAPEVTSLPAEMPPAVSDVPVEDIPPTAVPEPPASPTVDPALANVGLPAPADLETRWREMQVERTPFDARPYTSPNYQIVWWFDPIFGQILPIGQLRGDFTVQATFRIKGHWVTALEIPYHINQEYDIVVPDAILQRMRDAGKTEWAEVFIYQTNDVHPK